MAGRYSAGTGMEGRTGYLVMRTFVRAAAVAAVVMCLTGCASTTAVTARVTVGGGNGPGPGKPVRPVAVLEIRSEF